MLVVTQFYVGYAGERAFPITIIDHFSRPALSSSVFSDVQNDLREDNVASGLRLTKQIYSVSDSSYVSGSIALEAGPNIKHLA